MTYPRNADSPEPIAIGAVVQISDGAVQTSGCTVRIKPVGVAEGDGVGTTAYSTDGVVLYTPTQAETNYTSFVLIAKKTGCIPVSVTVVTSASATAGYVGTDQGKIANATSTVNLSNTTIKAVTDAVTLPASANIAITGNITGNLSGSVGSVTGNVGGNVVGSVGSISGVTFPSNFASLGINASGHVLRVTLVDTTTANTDMITAAGIRAAVGLASANLDTQLADLPTVAEFEARTIVAANYATAANLATVAGYLDTEIAAILADTNELQSDWADGGRLDLILDARASQSSVDTIDDLLDTEVAAIKADTAAILLDTGTDGVVVAAASKTGYSLSGTLTTLDALWAKIQKWLRLGFRKDAAVATDHATELSEINANGGSGAGAFANTTDSLEAIRDRGDAAWTTGGGGGSGSGAYTVTLTVTDDAAAAVQGAIVRLSKTGEAYTATTNASGVATFALDAATWTVAITAGGAYAFTPTTLVVSGDTSQTYSLTDNAPSPPAAPLLSTGYLDCYGTDGAAEEGVDIEIVLKTGPGTAGYGLDTGTATATSAANGRASHSGFVRGATYQARRGPAGSWVTFTVPNAGTFQLPETLGKP